ncbi:MAG: T9SS type A sorting domain-containing protein [Saprospiraceae bacterium]|nr:T9SS type A sorting domain-containing protein [Saprospiraceae bacterium]
MQKTLLLLLVLLPVLLQAQDDPPIVASGSYETDFYKWSFTMGDLCILTLQTNENCWTQGSQQPVLNTVAVQQPDLPGASVALYPNPTAEYMFCTVSMPTDHIALRTDIFDLTGRYVALSVPPFQSNETVRITLSTLPSGSYFIAFSDPEGRSIVKQFQKL